MTSSFSSSTSPATLAFGAGPNSSIQYTAWGAVSQLQNGCAGSGCKNIQETYLYNKRMQMAVAELGTSSSHAADSCREYSYYANSVPTGCTESSSAWPTGTTNNGSVAGYYYADSANTSLSHQAAYHYDGANRLVSAAATGSATYSQAYSYDVWGNLNCSPAGPGCVALAYNTATNRITTSGYTYDAAGNLTGDGTYTYHWDAEGRLTSVYQSGNVVSLNTYNALGQRVEDVTASSTTDEAYGADGTLLLRYTGDSNSRSFVPFAGGGLLAEYFCGGMILDHPDELGSLTASTDCTGNTVNEKLFYPYGEMWTGAALPNLGAHQEFGKLPDYDAETDQYNTANRHYSPSGRWLSPDPGGLKAVKLDDPQIWNMYAYVRNNPTTLTDPSGESWWSEFQQKYWPTLMFPHQAAGDPPPELPPPPSPEAQLAEKQAAQNTVTVEQVQGQGANVFDHAAISVKGQQAVGLEQKKDSAAAALEDKTTPGAVKPVDPNRKVEDKAVIQVTPEQAAKIQTFLNNAKQNPPNYDLYHSNCAQFCESALRAGGMRNVPNDVTPHGLVQDLKGSPSVMDYIRMVPIPPIF